jgi:hypothetical protein
MVKVRLTDRGLEVVRNLKDAVHRCHKDQFQGLSPDRLEQLRVALRELAREERPATGSEEESMSSQPRQVGAGS